MKIVGIILICIAVISAGRGFFIFNDTEIEGMTERLADMKKNNYEFAKNSEKYFGMKGRSDWTDSSDLKESLSETGSKLQDLRETRQRNSIIAFCVSGVFLIGGLICLSSRPPVVVLPPSVASKRQSLPTTPNIPQRNLRVARGQNDLGDIPIETARGMLSSGLLKNDDYYWNDTCSEWRPLYEIFNTNSSESS